MQQQLLPSVIDVLATENEEMQVEAGQALIKMIKEDLLIDPHQAQAYNPLGSTQET